MNNNNDYHFQYRLKNKEKLKEYGRQYYQNVYRPKTLNDPEYYEKLKNRNKNNLKIYYQRNKDEIKEKASISYQNKKNGFVNNFNNNNVYIPITIEKYKITLFFD
jgi:hypothetical protein